MYVPPSPSLPTHRITLTDASHLCMRSRCNLILCIVKSYSDSKVHSFTHFTKPQIIIITLTYNHSISCQSLLSAISYCRSAQASRDIKEGGKQTLNLSLGLSYQVLISPILCHKRKYNRFHLDCEEL